MPSSTSTGARSKLLREAADQCRAAGVFGQVTVSDTLLECQARASAAPAFFRLSFEQDKLWVSLVTSDRWLSQSIEADLVHTGDKLEDLLAEELADLDYLGKPPAFEHFRSEDKLFTFRSVVPVEPAGAGAAKTAAVFVLAYEACFRRLGDMESSEE
jgi:hypothetical protein